MPKLILLIVCSFWCSVSFTQGFIGEKRQKVKKTFESYLQRNAISEGVKETDSSLVFSVNNPKLKPVDFAFLFDGDDICIAEIKTGCDTCLANYMQRALDNKSFGWRQHGPNRFLSNQRYKVAMELTADDKGSKLVIRKIPLNRREYQKVLEGLKK